jgi:hypothetical protein
MPRWSFPFRVVGGTLACAWKRQRQPKSRVVAHWNRTKQIMQRQAGAMLVLAERERQMLGLQTTYSAAFSAKLPEAASIVCLHPFLCEPSLVVVSEDVHELENDPTASRRKRADG